MTTPNVVACPHCGGQIATDPRLAGQQVACPHCKRRLLMPPAPVLPQAKPLAEESPSVESEPLDFLESLSAGSGTQAHTSSHMPRKGSTYTARNKKKANHYWENPVLVGVLLLFCFPLGLFLVWKHSSWTPRTKWIWTGVWATLAVIGVLNSKDNSKGGVGTTGPDSSARASMLINIVKDGRTQAYPNFTIGSAFSDPMSDVRWNSFNNSDGAPCVSVSSSVGKVQFHFDWSVDPASQTWELKGGNLNGRALKQDDAAIVLHSILKQYAEKK